MSFTTRPCVAGYGGAVAAGHYLAAQIGAAELAAGGNAADAACAMGFALQVLEPHQNGPAGEVPILVWDARAERATAISGQGPAPAAATIEAMRARGLELIPPDGFLAAPVPGALDAWCLLLERFGTRRLADVLAPARGLAERGFPMYGFLRLILRLIAQRFETDWPSSAAIYLPLRAEGERQTNPPLGRFFGSLMDAERDASGSREARIRAARDSFYRGAPAAQIERFLATPIKDASGGQHAGLLTAHDMARYSGRFEDPCEVDYRGARVWKCGPCSQGPVFLQQLRLLEGFDMHAAGSRSAEALHLQIEAAKLAYADREACYGDPLFADVPLATLLSKEYASERRALIEHEKASMELRPGMGRLPEGWPRVLPNGAPQAPSVSPVVGPAEPHAVAASHGRRDTTQLVAVDREGNVVVATPSGGWIPTSPIVPELGFPIGTRLQMAVLDEHHPNALAPGKRPRTTLSPSLARLPGGRMLGFGTPGGDQQDQWTLPFFLDLVDHGIANLQEAIDAPSVHSEHAPSSFYPRYAQPGAVQAEDRFEPGVLEELERRGHKVVRASGWDHGRVLAVMHLTAPGLSMAAASPRFQTAYAIALP